jgi:DNA-binding PadR family transcriptional regulator
VLKYALLGLLVERDRHGYDLRAALDDLFGGAWSVNEGQVYATLSRLERDGLVEHDVVEQAGAPARKVHRITGEGDKVLRTWLEAPSAPRVRLRGGPYLQLVLRSRIDRAGLAEHIGQQRRQVLAELADLVAAHGQLDAASPTAMLLDAAAVQAEADLRWLERCERALGLA